MDFEEAKTLTLDQIIEKSDNRMVWAQVDFQKLIDAKIGVEIKWELYNLKNGLNVLPGNINTIIGKLIESNKELSETNAKYAKSLNWLTGGVVLVGLLQTFILVCK